MSKPQVIISGSIAIDRIMNFSGRYRDLIKPEKIHALSISTLLDKLEDSRGGIGANIASNLAQLGEQPILLGSVGADAQRYIDDLAQLGVDVSHIHYSQLATASFNVITDAEDSQVGGFYPGAMSDSQPLTLAPWQDQDVLVVVSPHDPKGMNRQVAECRDLGLQLIYDPGQQVIDPATDLAAGVDTAKILLVNDYELSTLCDKLGTTEAELSTKVPILVTTLGKEGSHISGTALPEPLTVSIAQPAQVVDPTGAGDAYRAGFLYGYLRQWDIKQCGQLGAVVASFIVEQHGTQRTLNLADITQRYQVTFNEEITL